MTAVYTIKIFTILNEPIYWRKKNNIKFNCKTYVCNGELKTAVSTNKQSK